MNEKFFTCDVAKRADCDERHAEIQTLASQAMVAGGGR